MHYSNLFRGLLAAVIAIFGSLAIDAQGGPQFAFSRQVNGQVRYADSKTPAQNIQVRLESTSGGVAGQAQTDRNGKFSFSGLRAEQFIVVVHTPGYRDFQENIDLMTASTGYVNAQLVRDKSDIAPGGTTTGVLDVNVPLEAQNEFVKAKALIDEGKDAKTKEGIVALEKAIAIYPKFFEAELMLGLAYMDLKQWDNAEKTLLATIEMNRGASTAYFALGEAYRREKKYPDGERILLEGLKINGDSAEGHATLAEVYWDMAPGSANQEIFRNRLETSWKEVDKALKLKPGLASAHLLAGNLLFKARRGEDALKHFEEYLKLEPKGAFVGDVKSLIQKIKQAMAQGGKT